MSWAFLLASLLSFSPASADRFADCRPFQDEIDKQVAQFWPEGLRDFPFLMTAQFYQESLCDAVAVSPAGARGFGQIMPGTQGDLDRRFGDRPSPFEARRNIRNSTFYMAQKMKTWSRRGRPPVEVLKLGQASYNSGTGNVLRAQKLCGGARDWSGIRPCQSRVTGRHARETLTYVERIERWTRDGDRWAHERIYLQRPAVRGWFHEGPTTQAPGTFFEVRGSLLATAAHVRDAQMGTVPPFTSGKYDCAPGVLDACLIGRIPATWPRPPVPVEGQSGFVIGFPGGSGLPSERRATVHFKRSVSGSPGYEMPTWIARIEPCPDDVDAATPESALCQPVFVGMSGSPFTVDGVPIGIVVAQNSRADLNNDRDPDQSFDFVAMSDVWDVFKGETP
ncbi:transglycosylase SLT domain-containing protein [Litorimonas sp. WD9-15]|uniref:transglycosylase SLT domain-containing protein n=1 Tax=Litorimonas sp. WD9-15 TaxID=3418716 RepID=UPI003D05ADA9